MPAPTPQQTQSQTATDFRPYGAAAGASLPTLSLLEYLFRTYPQYRKLIEEAPDWTRADGNVDLARAMKTLRPGDFGLAGLQRSKDGPLVDFLIQGSASAGGGPGAHGQVVGPHIRTPHRVANVAAGADTRPLAFLMNPNGELFSPALMRDRAKFINETIPNATEYLTSAGGANRYGLLKEKLRALSSELRLDRKNPKLVAQRDKTVQKLKKLLTVERATPTGGTYSTGLREFFTNPTTQHQDNLAELRQLGDTLDGTAGTAERARLSDLAKRFESRGLGARDKDLAHEIRRAIGQVGQQADRPVSKLLKPKAFETFVPALHHGGTMGSGHDPLIHWFTSLPTSVQKELSSRSGIGLREMRRQLRENVKTIAGDRRLVKRSPWSFFSQRFNGGLTDSVYDDLVKDKSTLAPKGYYFDTPRSTVWARMADDIDPNRLAGSLAREGTAPYATTGAINAGAKEVMGANMLRRWLPWTQKLPGVGTQGANKACVGHHCGSFPSAVMDSVGAAKSVLPHADVLPSTMLTGKNVKILGVTNKARLMKAMPYIAGRRGLLGLGAAGLMGAAGWGAGGVANALRAAPAKPLPPTLDPHMLAQAQKLFQPRVA
jgi:hypothetical protein